VFQLIKFDICVLTESKLDEFIPSTDFQLSQYYTNRLDRNSNGGGLITFIRYDLSPENLFDYQNRFVALGLEVTIDLIKTKDYQLRQLIVLGVYRPPNSRNIWFDTFQELIIELSLLGNIILLGDLNCNLLNENSTITKNLHNILELGNLFIPSNLPSRITENTISALDIIAIPKSITCIEYKVGDITISDHLPVEACLEIKYEFDSLKPVLRRNFKKLDYSQINNELKNISVMHLDQSDPNVLLSYWNDEVEKILDEYAPLKFFPLTKKHNYCLPLEIIQMINHKKRLVAKLRRSPHDITAVTQLKVQQKIVKSNISRYIKSQGESILSKKDNSREKWKFLKNITHSNQNKVRNSIDIDTLNTFFAKVVTSNSTDKTIISPLSCDPDDAFVLKECSVYSIQNSLFKSKVNISTGHDGLPALFLKNTAPALSTNITIILNSCIRNGRFPDSWKWANVIGIYKGKGKKSEPTNYRPISILPCLAKIFEKEIASQLSKYCFERNIIPDQQFGFRPRSNCESLLTVALDKWIGDLDKFGNIVGVLLIDLSKAFDNVNHSLLIKSLLDIGCSNSTLNLFIDFLSKRKFRVIQDNQVGSWMDISRGVPQGSCLSPILFNIYVRSLPSYVSDPIFQFADDLTNSSTSNNINDLRKNLTDNFHKIKAFCSELDLTINSEKTQCIILKLPSTKLDKEFELLLDNNSIKATNTVNLLGFTIDNHLTYKMHIDNVVKKCHGLLGVLNKSKFVLPQKLLKLFYTSIIRPHLEYCNLLLASASKTNLSKLDIIQKMACRIICNMPKDSHAEPLLNYLNLTSLSSRREEKIINTVHDIIDNNCHPSLCDMFVMGIDGLIVNNIICRTKFGKRRFSILAKDTYNYFINSD